MNVDDILKNNDPYLVNQQNTLDPFNKEFWRTCDNLEHSISSKEAYENGFKTGYKEAMKTLQDTLVIPYNVNLSNEEYFEIMSILNAFGCKFFHINTPKNNMHLGLNICKNLYAETISEEDKQKIIEIIKSSKSYVRRT